jgi:hypothetical protein
MRQQTKRARIGVARQPLGREQHVFPNGERIRPRGTRRRGGRFARVERHFRSINSH